MKIIAKNADVELKNKQGMFQLTNYTGHLSFDECTECDVENATLSICITNPGYLDGTLDYHAPWSRGVNFITWHNGTVVNGSLKCDEFENGDFNGDTLIVRHRMKGHFNGRKLCENVVY